MSNERTRPLWTIDPLLMLATVGLMTIGILFIFSSGVNSNGVSVSSEYLKQLMWGAIGVVIMVSMSYVNYNLLRDFSLWIYLLFLLLVVLTLFVGRVVNGARAWLGFFGLGIQPSEFCKIATILFLGRFLANRRQEIQDWKVFLQAVAIVLVPMALILREPDTGSTLVFIPVFLLMVFMAGGKVRHLLFVASVGVIGIVLALVPLVETIINHESNGIGSLLTDLRIVGLVSATLAVIVVLAMVGVRQFKDRVYYWIAYGSSIALVGLVTSFGLRMVLKDYQIMRFIVFLDPSIDPKGSGWNLIQSMTAIGSGGWAGKGFLAGTQSHYRFLPMQSTDFIFSILGEEWGFLGAIAVFSLFLVLLIRMLYIAQVIKDQYGVLVVSGIVAMLFTHMVVNIGMTIGVMPVTGIPLYFLSYGGSSMIVGSLIVGIVMNIHSRRFRF